MSRWSHRSETRLVWDGPERFSCRSTHAPRTRRRRYQCELGVSLQLLPLFFFLPNNKFTVSSLFFFVCQPPSLFYPSLLSCLIPVFINGALLFLDVLKMWSCLGFPFFLPLSLLPPHPSSLEPVWSTCRHLPSSSSSSYSSTSSPSPPRSPPPPLPRPPPTSRGLQALWSGGGREAV